MNEEGHKTSECHFFVHKPFNHELCGLFGWEQAAVIRLEQLSQQHSLISTLTVCDVDSRSLSSCFCRCVVSIYKNLAQSSAYLTDEICPPSWEYVHQTHSCYLRASRALPWEEAQTFCNEKGHGSSLATILSPQEMESVHCE